MSNTDRDLIAELADGLTRQSYSPVVVGNYCAYARGFLAFLTQHEILITAATPLLVAQYLRHAAVTFRKRRECEFSAFVAPANPRFSRGSLDRA